MEANFKVTNLVQELLTYSSGASAIWLNVLLTLFIRLWLSPYFYT